MTTDDGSATPPSATRVRLLLADDQDLVRGSLSALLSLEPDLEVVADVGRGDQVLDAVRRHTPDVALIDIEMPGIDGITATEQVVSAGLPCRCLIVTTFGRPGYLRRAMDAGACGFIVKDTPADQLARMVRSVVAGQRVVDPALAADSLVGGQSPLTPREQEVLSAAAAGGSIRSIAAELFLSQGTVRNHLSAAIGKTQAENRHDASRIARDNGWI